MVIVAFFIMPRVFMLSVVKHNVIILSVMAPFLWYRIQNLKDNLVWIGAEFTNAHLLFKRATDKMKNDGFNLILHQERGSLTQKTSHQSCWFNPQTSNICRLFVPLWACHRVPELGLLNKRLMLTSSFRCDQNYKFELYDFGHSLLCYLSRT